MIKTLVQTIALVGPLLVNFDFKSQNYLERPVSVMQMGTIQTCNSRKPATTSKGWRAEVCRGNTLNYFSEEVAEELSASRSTQIAQVFAGLAF